MVMSWQIRFEKKARKDLAKISLSYRNRILSVLAILQKDPFIGKKLVGELSDCYSYKVWPYRIIYKTYKKILLIIIIRIGHRQGVYK